MASAPDAKLPVTSAGSRLSVIEYDAPDMPGMASDRRAIALRCPSASDQNSFFPRTNVKASMVPITDTPTSPLPMSGASVVSGVSVSLGGDAKSPS